MQNKFNLLKTVYAKIFVIIKVLKYILMHCMNIYLCNFTYFQLLNLFSITIFNLFSITKEKKGFRINRKKYY